MNETPDDASIHERMEMAYLAQRDRFTYRKPSRQREEFNNRFRISAKLTPETYPALMKFCQERDLSVNSALRQILTDYFNLAA